MVFAEQSVSLARTAVDLTRRGIDCEFLPTERYDVASARDWLADQFLKSKATHLQFSDSDIGVPSNLTAQLLSFDRPIIGPLYPHREVHLGLLERFIRAGVSAEEALRLAHGFAASFDGTVQANGLANVPALGAGYMLIAREVFEKMAAAGVEEYRLHATGEKLKRFFPWKEDVEGERAPEDFSFCKRWRELGGEVWAFAVSDTVHVGTYRHIGNYIKTRQAIAKLPPA